MALKVSLKIGPGTGPLIVLKHPELSWMLTCVNHTAGKVFLLLNVIDISDLDSSKSIEVRDGYLLPKDTRTLRLISAGLPDTFSAYISGVPEDAVPVV